MRIRKTNLIVGLFLATLCITGIACKTDTAALQVENSLSQNEIAYYNDSFDKVREDLWDRGGYLFKKEHMQNFKQAEVRFVNGKLRIRTKTGSFSKGGFGSNFALRGGFDIQLDCRIDFFKGIPGMDQLANILVLDKSKSVNQADVVNINLIMAKGSHQAKIQSHYYINQKWKKGSQENIENFDGTLRIVRTGKDISTLYKNKGDSTWSHMHTFRVSDNDMIIGFQVRNFFNKRTSIQATHSIAAEFDNFRITAAQDIIEDEI